MQKSPFWVSIGLFCNSTLFVCRSLAKETQQIRELKCCFFKTPRCHPNDLMIFPHPLPPVVYVKCYFFVVIVLECSKKSACHTHFINLFKPSKNVCSNLVIQFVPKICLLSRGRKTYEEIL